MVLDRQVEAVQPRLCAQVLFAASGKHLFFNKWSLTGAWIEHSKIRHPFIVCEELGWNWHRDCEKHWLCFPLCVRSCALGCEALGAWAGTVQLPVSRPQCMLEQITHFYFYTNVHNFIHFLWLLWQEKEIYDAHHPFVWHRQCLLLREAFSWNWLHNFLLVYCFQVISEDLGVLRYRGTSLRPTEFYSRGRKEAM